MSRRNIKKRKRKINLEKISSLLLNKKVLMISLIVLLILGVNTLNSKLQNKEDDAKFKVFLDPGHGGKDKGSSTTKYIEAEINLQIANKVAKGLEEENIAVEMSRYEDEFLSLKERTNKSQSSGADLFISIHQNAAEAKSADGIETLYMKDNKELGEIIQNSLLEHTNAKDRKAKEKNLQVLRDSSIPAVLIETGFISNQTEGYKLSTESYQDKIAKGIVEGIKTYINKINQEEYEKNTDDNSELDINKEKYNKTNTEESKNNKSEDNKNIKIVLNNVEVKNGQGENFKTIGNLSKGDKVEVIDTRFGWHKIKFGDRYAYVSGVYVK